MAITKRTTKELNVTNSKEGKLVLMASILDKQIKNKTAQLANVKEQIKADLAEPTSETTLKYHATRVSKSGIEQVGVVTLTYRAESRSLDVKKVMGLLQDVNPDLAKQITENEELYKTTKATIEVKTDLTEVTIIEV